jgi:hypothetical protein
MDWTQESTTRRTALSAIGTGLAAGLLGTTVSGEQQRSSGYVITQGDRCVPVEPVRGEKPVREFYDYQLPEQYTSLSTGGSGGLSEPYSSAGTTALQRPQTSIAFLYQGPERLSLVVVHGSTDSQSGGSVTFRVTGLPTGGKWLVKDDLYRDPETGELASSNYDEWSASGTDHRIDWTWGAGGTDGGAFGGLGDEFDVVVHPAFNEAAALYGQHYEGTVTNWEFLSGADGQERISLGMDTALRISTGSCSSGAQTPTSTPTTDKPSEEQTPDSDDEEAREGAEEAKEEAEEAKEEAEEAKEEAEEEAEEAREEAKEEAEEAKEEAEEEKKEAKEEKEDWKEEKKEAKEEWKEEKEEWKEKKKEGKEDWKEEKEEWKEEKKEAKEEWKEEKEDWKEEKKEAKEERKEENEESEDDD